MPIGDPPAQGLEPPPGLRPEAPLEANLFDHRVIRPLLRVAGGVTSNARFVGWPTGQNVLFDPRLDRRAEDVVARSLYFQELLGRTYGEYALIGERLRHGLPYAALDILEKYVDPYPNFVQGRIDLGDLYLEVDEYAKARAELEAARSLSPDDLRVKAGLARMSAVSGN
jgi:hypothetical protein